MSVGIGPTVPRTFTVFRDEAADVSSIPKEPRILAGDAPLGPRSQQHKVFGGSCVSYGSGTNEEGVLRAVVVNSGVSLARVGGTGGGDAEAVSPVVVAPSNPVDAWPLWASGRKFSLHALSATVIIGDLRDEKALAKESLLRSLEDAVVQIRSEEPMGHINKKLVRLTFRLFSLFLVNSLIELVVLLFCQEGWDKLALVGKRNVLKLSTEWLLAIPGKITVAEKLLVRRDVDSLRRLLESLIEPPKTKVTRRFALTQNLPISIRTLSANSLNRVRILGLSMSVPKILG